MKFTIYLEHTKTDLQSFYNPKNITKKALKDAGSTIESNFCFFFLYLDARLCWQMPPLGEVRM